MRSKGPKYAVFCCVFLGILAFVPFAVGRKKDKSSAAARKWTSRNALSIS